MEVWGFGVAIRQAAKRSSIERNKKMNRILRHGQMIAVAAMAFMLSGCDKETTLHAGLEEQQANLVMAAL